MQQERVYIGLDYHSRSVQVCVVDQKGSVLVNRRCGNSVAEVAGVVRANWAIGRVAIESCCGAADFAEALKRDADWPVELAHPGYVHRMKHNPDKTDYADARMLAELCRAGFLPPVWLAPACVRELRLLIRLRADLVARIRTVKTRILGVLRAQRVVEPVKPGRWGRGWVAWLKSAASLSEMAAFVIGTHLEEWRSLKDRVREVEAKLEQRLCDDPVVMRLLEQPGIGKITAWTMRAIIGEFSRFRTGKQLSRFCAVTPRNSSSGERVVDSGLVKAGDPLLKSVLIEAAHRLRRYEPRWAEFSERLASGGKPTCVIIAAIANRWIRWLYHRIKEVEVRAAAA